MESATSLAIGVTKGAGERIKYRIKEWKTARERKRKTVVKWMFKGGRKYNRQMIGLWFVYISLCIYLHLD